MGAPAGSTPPTLTQPRELSMEASAALRLQYAHCPEEQESPSVYPLHPAGTTSGHCRELSWQVAPRALQESLHDAEPVARCHVITVDAISN